MISLHELLVDITDCQVYGSHNTMVRALTTHSKLVTPGALFIAKQGYTFDGSQFIVEAITNGASVIVKDVFDPALTNIVQVVHPNIAIFEAQSANNYYHRPSEKLMMIGVTGTNGKTTITYLIQQLLERLYGTTGLIGTVKYFNGKQDFISTHTTPDALTNQQLLHEMVLHNCRAAVMEVSSHALVQGRTMQIDFDRAVFSNLTHEHLDYHGSMDHYCAAKNLLFRNLGRINSCKMQPKWAIINQDSIWNIEILDGCMESIFTYSIDQPAHLRATHIKLEQNGTYTNLNYGQEVIPCFWPLVGRFNVYNCLAAISVLITLNIPLSAIVQAMQYLQSAPGRLEYIANDLGLNIYVDYAVTDDAMENVLKTLNELRKQARLIVVFGCGGNRDRMKRPKMARVCERYADFTFVTSDNPRNEDPIQICQEIVVGFERAECYEIEIDRRLAIQKAIEQSKNGDFILIAGKGHENYQIFANQTVQFDDRQVVIDVCAALIS